MMLDLFTTHPPIIFIIKRYIFFIVIKCILIYYIIFHLYYFYRKIHLTHIISVGLIYNQQILQTQKPYNFQQYSNHSIGTNFQMQLPSKQSINRTHQYQNSSTLTQQNLTILLKSRNCLQKLTNRISTCKNSNKNNTTIKSIEQTAKEIKNVIDKNIDKNFINILNDHHRINFNQFNNCQLKNKQNAIKILMNDYWQKKDNNQKNNFQFADQNYKQNILPKIKYNSICNDQKYINKNKKISDMSSFNIKMYQKSKKNTNNQKVLKLNNNLNYVKVIDYLVQNNSVQFLEFEKKNYMNFNEISNILNCIQNFTKKYQIKYCVINLPQTLLLINTKAKTQKYIKNNNYNHYFNTTKDLPSCFRKYTPHQLLSCLQNGQQISENNRNKSGIRYYGNRGKVRAVTKIQSVWRGRIQFKKMKKMCQRIQAAIKIQKKYKIYKNYQQTKQIINRKCLQKYQWFTQNQKQFKDNYRIHQLSKKLKYQIHICYDGISEWQRVSTQKFKQKQNSYLTRIFKAFKQNSIIQTRIILVTLSPISSQILDYYYKLLQLRSATQFNNRVCFLSATQQTIFQDKTSLPLLLYYCPSVLKKIKSIINNNYAYIIPSTPSNDYIHICHYLNLPLYSSNPQVLLSLQTNSGCKTFLQQLNKNNQQFNIIPYAKNIYSLKYLISQITVLILTNPNVLKWILKIDNQENSRGLAIVEVNKLLPKKLIKYIRKTYNQFSPNQTKNTIIPQLNSLSQQVFNIISETFVRGQKLTIVNNSVYRNQSQYLTSYFTNGGIIEADLNISDKSIQNQCYCINIEPDRQYSVICNYKKISIKKRSLCCYYSPSQPSQPQQLKQIIKQLINRKHFGYFIINLLKISQQKKKKCNKIYLNGIKCYLDIFSSSSFMRQFISKSSHSLYIPFIPHYNIQKITISNFFQLCRLQNISFDIQKKIGNIFTFLDHLQSGCIGLMTFNDNSKIQTFIHAAQFLDFLINNNNNNNNLGQIKDQFIIIRNSINGYLNQQKNNKNIKELKQSYLGKKIQQFMPKDYFL